MPIHIETEKIRHNNVRARRIISFELKTFSELPHQYVIRGDTLYLSQDKMELALFTDDTETTLLFGKIQGTQSKRFSMMLHVGSIIHESEFGHLLNFIKTCKKRLKTINALDFFDESTDEWQGKESHII